MSEDRLVNQLVVVTDIEDSLREADACSLLAERAAVEFLASHGVPLIINSRRTRAEIERLHERLELLTPFISEHGSALFLPPGCLPVIPADATRTVSGHVIEFGRPYHEVADAVRITSRELSINIVGFADLTIDDAARELGVTGVEAQLAKLREYTELIRIADETDSKRSRVFNTLRWRGLRCWPAGRHHLVTATRNRADSLLTFKALWRNAWGEPRIIGVGNSDDVAWLRYVDLAVIVQNDRDGIHPRVLSKLPNAQVTRRSGRQGWSDAIFDHVGADLR